MVDDHDRKKKFDCESFGKKFFLQWRLKQHVFIHTEKVSACQYFLNEEHCPFDLIGCKFSHIKEVAKEEMIEDIEDDGSTDDECYDINSTTETIYGNMWKQVTENISKACWKCRKPRRIVSQLIGPWFGQAG